MGALRHRLQTLGMFNSAFDS